jgi:hypothetical protein
MTYDGYGFRVWSASVPLDVVDGEIVAQRDVRPWNGRPLTEAEVQGCLQAAREGGPQAAYEWLSEHAR